MLERERLKQVQARRERVLQQVQAAAASAKAAVAAADGVRAGVVEGAGEVQAACEALHRWVRAPETTL